MIYNWVDGPDFHTRYCHVIVRWLWKRMLLFSKFRDDATMNISTGLPKSLRLTAYNIQDLDTKFTFWKCGAYGILTGHKIEGYNVPLSRAKRSPYLSDYCFVHMTMDVIVTQLVVRLSLLCLPHSCIKKNKRWLLTAGNREVKKEQSTSRSPGELSVMHGKTFTNHMAASWIIRDERKEKKSIFFSLYIVIFNHVMM